MSPGTEDDARAEVTGPFGQVAAPIAGAPRGGGEPQAGALSESTLFVTGGRPAPRSGVPRSIVLPREIGRYVVLGELGQGGMGVVYAAYDPGLDRKVAIKLLHTKRRNDPTLRARMEREAQAMARLSHPNVVTIYEVGEHEGQLFLVMEFVVGQDLRGWLAKRGPQAGWREVLAVFLQAGEGLAAAHAVGIVHRDFKPGNVFVGDDGRVRVGDFGLARRESEQELETTASRAEAAAAPPVLTQTGVAMGTPAYMAPEQFEGLPTDGRTDEFAFCVALWEALHGARPFAGETLAELLVNVTQGLRAPPPARGVPEWLRRVLARGLSRWPEDRYPTIAALLAALRADPTRRRRALAAAGAIGLAVVGGFVGQGDREARRVAACEAAGASVAEVWDAAAEGRLREGLRATGVAYAETTADRVAASFAGQAAAWRAGRAEACLHAEVRGAWGAETLDRASWCLEERRSEMAALLAELTRATPEVMPRAVHAAGRLARVEPCLDAGRLARLPAPPQDRAAVQEVQALLYQAQAKQTAGAYAEGLALAERALAQAEALGWAPLVAAARARRGSLLDDRGEYGPAEAALEGAFFQAAALAAWESAAVAAENLVTTVGLRQARHAEGLRWSRHAEVMHALLGEADHGLRRAALLNNVGSVHRAAGDPAAARAMHEEALVIREAALGPEHPMVAQSLNNLANLRADAGELAEAAALYQRALAIKERALGPDHPELAQSLNNLATVHLEAGATDEAMPLLERALAIREEALGPDHPEVADTLNNLAVLYEAADEFEEARALCRRALAIKERTLGPDHLSVVDALSNLTDIELLARGYGEARVAGERALAIAEAALGPTHPALAHTLVSLARVAVVQRRDDEAIALVDRAMRLVEGKEAPADVLAMGRFVLARALWARSGGGGPSATRALALAREAREGFTAEAHRAEVDALLQELAGG